MSLRRHICVFTGLALIMAAVSARAETLQVTIDRLVFSPADITAKVGDTIEWINKDPITHTATVKGDWEVMIPPKKTATQVLDSVQSVDYYCRFHPNMKGKLTVVAP